MHEASIILGLILLNALFSMSEMAIVSANRPLLKQMAKEGNRRAAMALRLAEESGRFLSTVQIGITLVGTLAGAYGGATIAETLGRHLSGMAFIGPYSDEVAVALVVGAITYLSVVIGELVPKHIALGRPEKVAMLVARPMRLLVAFCTPAVMLLNGSAEIITRALGFLVGRQAAVGEAELKAVLAEGAESGAIDKNEHDMLQRIIRLSERDLKSVMTHRTEMTCLHLGDSLEKVRDIVARTGHSRYPVVDRDADHVVGYVETAELFGAGWHKGSGASFSLRYHLHPHVTLSSRTDCREALQRVKREAVPLIVIVDELGVTLGIVTLSDLLEAIVGALPSNYDGEGAAMIREWEDGSWLVDGLTPIGELRLHLHLNLGLPEHHAPYDTLAGFLLYSMGLAPEEGRVLERHGHRFEIIDMDGRRIDKVLIRQIVESED